MHCIVFTFIAILTIATTTANAMNDRSAVDVSDNMRACTSDADCMVVDTDCQDCCGFDAIAKSQLTAFVATKKSTCPKPNVLCDCLLDAKKKSACISKHCVYQ